MKRRQIDVFWRQNHRTDSYTVNRQLIPEFVVGKSQIIDSLLNQAELTSH